MQFSLHRYKAQLQSEPASNSTNTLSPILLIPPLGPLLLAPQTSLIKNCFPADSHIKTAAAAEPWVIKTVIGPATFFASYLP